jgi:hypothetical protein
MGGGLFGAALPTPPLTQFAATLPAAFAGGGESARATEQ